MTIPEYVRAAQDSVNGFRWTIGNEAEFDRAVCQVLSTMSVDLGGPSSQKVPLLPQFRLGDLGTIDAYIPSLRLGLEFKVKGRPSEVRRQLHRYASSAEVDAVALVTISSRLRDMPARLFGKPVYIIAVSAGGQL
jgi:hypothetical protein